VKPAPELPLEPLEPVLPLGPVLPVEPVPPLDLEPIFGQGCPPGMPDRGMPDFDAGGGPGGRASAGGVVGVALVAAGAWVPVAAVGLGAAAAPAMPAIAPALASAPVTITLPSIFLDTFMRSNLLGVGRLLMPTIVGPGPKPPCCIA
jgi:uncharacterized membrane protein YphA (DoxX/SURF4 family)